VPADGVITRWTVRDAKGTLALRVVDGPAGQRRVVAKGPPQRVPGNGVRSFSVRIPVKRGQYIGVELGRAGYLPFRYRDEVSRADFYLPPLGDKPTAPMADAGGSENYEWNYNATIEPDADHDGQGDLTQDADHGGAGAACPTDGLLASGSGSVVAREGGAVVACRGGVRTPVGGGAGTQYRLFRFSGDRLALVKVAGGRSTFEIYDLGDQRRTLSSTQTADDDRPAEWTVTDLVLSREGNAAWMSMPRGAPDRVGLWVLSGGSVQEADSGPLETGSLKLHPAQHGVNYNLTTGGDRNVGF
jgi:hypothetical protein